MEERQPSGGSDKRKSLPHLKCSCLENLKIHAYLEYVCMADKGSQRSNTSFLHIKLNRTFIQYFIFFLFTTGILVTNQNDIKNISHRYKK